MFTNNTVRTLAATAAALLLTLGAFTGGAVAQDADDANALETEDLPEGPSTTNCLQVYVERSVGPATVTYNCGFEGDIDEDWEPSDEASVTTGPPCSMDPDDKYLEAGPLTVYQGPFCEPYPEYDEEWEPSDELATTADQQNCFYIYYEKQVGPVTYTMYSSCHSEVEVDEDWEPGVSVTTDHMSPEDNPGDAVKCFLTADSDVERWACFFGPPGP